MQIDEIELNFNEDGLFLLNIMLAFIMFGVALDLKAEDFKRIIQNPKSSFVGIFSQLVALPAVTVLLVSIIKPHPSIGLGMILVAACPGGNISNFVCHLAKGNTALSVSLTAVSTSVSVFLTPLSFAFWSQFLPEVKALINTFSLNVLDMFFTIVILLAVPLILGLLCAAYFPKITLKIKKGIRVLSLLFFIGFVIAALMLNWEHFKNYVHVVMLLVFIHNALALGSGFAIAKMAKLSDYEARAVSIETGIQNSGLGLVIIFNFFGGVGGMALVAAWWGIWHIISGSVLALYWAKYKPLNEEVTNWD